MKKVLFIGVLGLIAFSSCKKEKDCECVTKEDGNLMFKIKYENKDCSSLESSKTDIDGIIISVECTEF